MLRSSVKLIDGSIIPLPLDLAAELFSRSDAMAIFEDGKLSSAQRTFVWAELYRDPPIPGYMEVLVNWEDLGRLMESRKRRKEKDG